MEHLICEDSLRKLGLVILGREGSRGAKKRKGTDSLVGFAVIRQGEMVSNLKREVVDWVLGRNLL